jgi:hypothetical protein
VRASPSNFMTEHNAQPHTEVIDADAFVPRNTRKIKIDGEVHHIVDVFNLSNRQVLRIQNLNDLIKDLDGPQQYDLFIEIIRDFIPTLSREAIDAMPYSKIGWLMSTLLATIRKSDVPFVPPNA